MDAGSMRDPFGSEQDAAAKSDGRFWLFAGCLTVILTAAVLITTDRFTYTSPTFSHIGDHHKYIEMARAPFTFHIAPYCWRILVPLLVHWITLLGVDMQWGFLVVDVVGVSGTALVLFGILKAMGYAPEYGLAGIMIFYSFGFATRYPLTAWLPDALSFLFIALGIYFIFARKDAWFAVTLAVGATVKESIFFVIPLYYTLNARRLIDGRVFRRMVFLALPAILVGIAIRLAIPAWNDNPSYVAALPDELRVVQSGTSSYGLVESFRLVGFSRLLHFDFIKLATVGTFGFWGVSLPLFAIRENLRVLIKFSPFIALVFAQLLFAVNNQRLIVLVFPPVIIMCVNGWRTLCRMLDIRAVFLLVPVAYGLFLMLRMSSTSYVYMPSSNRDVIILLALFAWALQRLNRKVEQALP